MGTCVLHHVEPIIMAERVCTPGQPLRPEESVRMVAHPDAAPAHPKTQIAEYGIAAWRCPHCATEFIPDRTDDRRMQR